MKRSRSSRHVPALDKAERFEKEVREIARRRQAMEQVLTEQQHEIEGRFLAQLNRWISAITEEREMGIDDESSDQPKDGA